jgi:hypothetical protein
MEQPFTPRRRYKAALGATLAAGLAVTGISVAFAEDEDPAADAEVVAIHDARDDRIPAARRAVWMDQVGEYVEADMVQRYAVAVYGQLADWHAAEEYAEALAAAAPSAGGSSVLAAIRACESGGDYTAVSESGTYRGAYQFDQATWEAMGGSGDPAAAPPAEQDMRAQMLYDQAGPSPWPVCGQ